MKKTIILFFLATVLISACTEEHVRPKADEGCLIDPGGKPCKGS